MEVQAKQPDRMLPPAVVIDRTSLSRTTLWRLVKRDAFPKPVSISPGRVAWPESAVQAWIAGKMTEAA